MHVGVREGEEGDVVLVMVSQSSRVCLANPTRPGEVERERKKGGGGDKQRQRQTMRFRDALIPPFNLRPHSR